MTSLSWLVTKNHDCGARWGKMQATIVVCTRNRCLSLRRTLSSLQELLLPQAFRCEIVVVDNNSTDHTSRIAQEFSPTSRIPVRYLLEEAPGLAHARNRGIQGARGEIIAFIDDDITVCPSWLAELKRAFDEYGAACVGGKILLNESLKLPAWWDARCDAVLARFDLGDSVIVTSSQDDREIGWGANMSFRRSVFEKYGHFRTDLGVRPGARLVCEESEMVQRLRGNGEVAVYLPTAVAYHFPEVERISKKFVRTWYFRLGESTFVWDWKSSDPITRIGSVPRWRYKWALKRLGSLIISVMDLGSKEAFFRELEFLSALGYFARAYRRG